MKCRNRITQSFAMCEGNREHQLTYYKLSHHQNGQVAYGIAIVQDSLSGTHEEEAFPLAANEADVLELIELFAQHFVFPISLHDILEDMDCMACV